VAKGPLEQGLYDAIRERWKEVAGSDWTGRI